MGIWSRKHCVALSGEMALGEVMYLSQEGLTFDFDSIYVACNDVLYTRLYSVSDRGSVRLTYHWGTFA
jgi:hypothetical protein